VTVSELLVKIEAEIEATARTIVIGNPVDWTEYKRLVARIQAFREVIQMTQSPGKTNEIKGTDASY
jgi:RNase H-fold protein (predicted Holliday junction resolvase)